MQNVSEDKEEAYLKGQYVTVASVKETYSLALTINNDEIVKILYETDRPLGIKTIAKLMNPKYTTQQQEQLRLQMRKLFVNKLLVKFRGNKTDRWCYLLSRKGAVRYQEMLKLPKKL